MGNNFSSSEAALENHELNSSDLREVRQIKFLSDSFEQVDILRRENNGPWKFLAKDIKSPYVDEEYMDRSSIDYKIIIKDNVGSSRTEHIIKMSLT